VDNAFEPPSAPPVARFFPDKRFTWLAALGTVVAALACALTGDPAGRLLTGAAAVILAAYAATDLIFAPRLTADRDGLTIRSPLLRAQLPWAAVENVRADVRNRYGLRSTTLEVDAGETFAVFSRRSLGTDPEEAAALVRAFWPRAPRR
jgi:hypothetical protein